MIPRIIMNNCSKKATMLEKEKHQKEIRVRRQLVSSSQKADFKNYPHKMLIRKVKVPMNLGINMLDINKLSSATMHREN